MLDFTAKLARQSLQADQSGWDQSSVPQAEESPGSTGKGDG